MSSVPGSCDRCDLGRGATPALHRSFETGKERGLSFRANGDGDDLSPASLADGMGGALKNPHQKL